MLARIRNFMVFRRTLIIGSVAIFSLVICSIYIDSIHPGITNYFTGLHILSTLQTFKRPPNTLESSDLGYKINVTTNSSSFNSSHGVLLSFVTVYYVWCQTHYFEFRHYLSVKSAIQFLQPHQIILYHRLHLHFDDKLYNTWLGELQQDFPFLEAVEAPNESCYNWMPNISFIYELTNERKGIYLGENTVLTQPLPETHHAAILAIGKNSGLVDVLLINEKLLHEPDLAIISTKSLLLECPLVSELDNVNDIPSCIVLDKGLYPLYPKDIWFAEDVFGRFARKLFYGYSEPISVLKPSYDELIPNIGHMIWFGGGKMDFLFFLGVLSLLNVARVDTVYIHGDKPPSGYYWSLLKDDPRVVHVPQYGVHKIYGRSVKSFNHKSDVLRVELMYRYGGIYLDVDAVFVRELDSEIRGYDAVASYDWIDWDHPFPEVINFGVTIGKKKAEFWRLFRESMKWFIDKDFSWNGLRRPYQILERHPGLIRMDPHLQVICFELKCHATWWDDFHNESVHHLNSPFNWRSDTYAVHWTDPTPPELTDFEQLDTSDSMFAEIGKYILSRSGIITQNLRETVANGSAV